MARKKKKQPAGAPEWMVTYGDMMTLLLCFFVMLVSFMKMKEEEKLRPVIEAIKEAFGYTGGSGSVPTNELPVNSVHELLQETALYREQERRLSQADDPGMFGKQTTVKRVREGLQYTVGGSITFEPGSAELKPAALDQLKRIADVIRGKNNKLEVRGHASAADLRLDGGATGNWNLSYERARAVMTFLTRPAQGIRPERIRVVACGDQEPLVRRAYDQKQQAVNRRVEIIVVESLVQDFEADMAASVMPIDE